MSNISRSKDNQTMKFGRSIECNMGNIFLKTLCTKYGGETSPRHFSEKLKLSISSTQWPKVLYCLFLLHLKWRAIEIYWDEAADLHIRLFKKIKRDLELISLPHFLPNFRRKIFLLLYSINRPGFFAWLPLPHELLANMCIAIAC